MDIYAPRYRANCVDHLINRLYLDLLLSNMTNVLKKVTLNVEKKTEINRRRIGILWNLPYSLNRWI